MRALPLLWVPREWLGQGCKARSPRPIPPHPHRLPSALCALIGNRSRELRPILKQEARACVSLGEPAGRPGRRMEEQRALAAAKDGDLATLEQLLEAGTLGPHVTDALGAGLVHHAARAGHLACVRFLVQRAKLPGNQRAHNGATPAHDAAATGGLAELCWLVRHGGCGLQVSGAQQRRRLQGAGPASMGRREPRARSGARASPGPWAAALGGMATGLPQHTQWCVSTPCPSPAPNKALRSHRRPLNHLVFPNVQHRAAPLVLSPNAPTQEHSALPVGGLLGSLSYQA